MSILEDILNPSQLEAVTTVGGPLLVIAGAGSGKTRVIEYRVLNLIQEETPPDSVLLLTFTRRAASEMLSRAARHDSRCERVEGGTFHSFGYKILKKYSEILKIPSSFSILDEGDSEEAVRRCCVQIGFLEKHKRFPKKDTLKQIISASINKNLSIEEVLLKEYPHFLEYTPKIEILKEKYREYKVNYNYLDYDDLLLYLKILLEDENIRSKLSEQYQFVMVDEYQDTNFLQGEITYLLGKERENIMVVGDDAQSIYGFRGASHKNIMDFPKKFQKCKIVKLETNYRSTQAILNLSSTILENMKNKYSKCLVSAKNQEGIIPKLLFFRNIYGETEWIVNKIIELRESGIKLNQQGILFRSLYISMPLQAELSRRNIAYRVFGGIRFYETAHIKDILAYFKILINPQDELAWSRALMLIEGIGEKTCEKILARISKNQNSETTNINLDYKGIKDKYTEELVKLKNVLQSASGKNLNTGEKFDVILNYYEDIFKRKFDDWHLRINDLYILKEIFKRYKKLDELLADFATELPGNNLWKGSLTVDNDDYISLSTIHSAKGLEWEVIFLIGLVDGILPSGFALENEDEIEEENRLFYVGVTRAKSQLFLSMHCERARGGGNNFNEISRFVNKDNVLSRLEKYDMLQDGMERKIPFIKGW